MRAPWYSLVKNLRIIFFGPATLYRGETADEIRSSMFLDNYGC